MNTIKTNNACKAIYERLRACIASFLAMVLIKAAGGKGNYAVTNICFRLKH